MQLVNLKDGEQMTETKTITTKRICTDCINAQIIDDEHFYCHYFKMLYNIGEQDICGKFEANNNPANYCFFCGSELRFQERKTTYRKDGELWIFKESITTKRCGKCKLVFRHITSDFKPVIVYNRFEQEKEVKNKNG